MSRLSIRARVAIASAALSFAVLVGVGVFVYRELGAELARQAAGQAREDAARLAGLVDTGGGEQQGTAVDIRDPTLVSQLAVPSNAVIVVGPSGNVLRASASPVPSYPAALISTCLVRGSAAAATADREFACQRVGHAARPLGAIVTGVSLAPRDQTLGRMRRVIAAALVAAFGLVLVLAWITTRRALRPLSRIATTAHEISAGATDRRIDYKGPRDEVGVLAAELDRGFERLERSLTEQQRFLADASHELRSPLAAARGHVELLQRWAGVDATARKQALDALHRSIARMTRLVDDLLHVAHGETGPEYSRSAVNLDDLLVELHNETRALGHDARVVLRITDHAVVIGDRDKLHQLVRNLIDNSLRHTDRGGEVQLVLRREARIAEISVVDTGCGIPAAQLTRIFERRYQGEHEPATGGAGLGLSIALDIARAHGGTIDVESEKAHGTTVRVRLPLPVETFSSTHYDPLTQVSPAPPNVEVTP